MWSGCEEAKEREGLRWEPGFQSTSCSLTYLESSFVLVGFDLLMRRPSLIRTLSNVLILESNNCGMHGF